VTILLVAGTVFLLLGLIGNMVEFFTMKMKPNVSYQSAPTVRAIIICIVGLLIVGDALWKRLRKQ
jgi:hypothetical protein